MTSPWERTDCHVCGRPWQELRLETTQCYSCGERICADCINDFALSAASPEPYELVPICDECLPRACRRCGEDTDTLAEAETGYLCCAHCRASIARAIERMNDPESGPRSIAEQCAAAWAIKRSLR